MTAHPVLGRYLERISFGTHYLDPQSELPEAQLAIAKGLDEFFESEEHIHMLTRALRKIESHRVHPTLGIHDDVAEIKRAHDLVEEKVLLQTAYGFRVTYGNLENLEWFRANQGKTFKAIDLATWEARHFLSRVEMSLCDGSSLPTVDKSDLDFDRAITDFMHQTVLEPVGVGEVLYLNKLLVIVGHQPKQLTASNMFFNTHNPRLGFSTLYANKDSQKDLQLKVSFDEDSLSNYGYMFSNTFRELILRELTLSNCYVDLDFLRGFLSDQRSSLRWLVLRELEVYFVDEDEDVQDQRGPLAFLQDLNLMQLDFLMLQELISTRDSTRVIGPRVGMFQGLKIHPALQTFTQREELILNFIRNDQPIPDALIDPQIPEDIRERLAVFDDPNIS